jgi:hypothetical protein
MVGKRQLSLLNKLKDSFMIGIQWPQSEVNTPNAHFYLLNHTSWIFSCIYAIKFMALLRTYFPSKHTTLLKYNRYAILRPPFRTAYTRGMKLCSFRRVMQSISNSLHPTATDAKFAYNVLTNRLTIKRPRFALEFLKLSISPSQTLIFKSYYVSNSHAQPRSILPKSPKRRPQFPSSRLSKLMICR